MHLAAVRSHPVAGSFFILVGLALFALGAFGGWAFDPPGPLPPSVVVPFILWQLALWSVLFGIFFLRPRGRVAPRKTRFAL